jgi:acetyl-CoA carboxylase beta subunit
MAEAVQRITIGLAGPQVLDLRVAEEAYKDLRDALESGTAGWHTIPTQDSEVYVDLSKVVYVSLASQEQRVGF